MHYRQRELSSSVLSLKAKKNKRITEEKKSRLVIVFICCVCVHITAVLTGDIVLTVGIVAGEWVGSPHR